MIGCVLVAQSLLDDPDSALVGYLDCQCMLNDASSL